MRSTMLAFGGVSRCGAHDGGAPRPRRRAARAPGRRTASTTTTPTTTDRPGKPGKARLTKNGKAIPPADAPPAVQNAIMAANGSASCPTATAAATPASTTAATTARARSASCSTRRGCWRARCPRARFMSWGLPGKGAGSRVFANGGHAYAVIAGLRWDTSAMGSGGNGPRWRATKRKPARLRGQARRGLLARGASACRPGRRRACRRSRRRRRGAAGARPSRGACSRTR